MRLRAIGPVFHRSWSMAASVWSRLFGILLMAARKTVNPSCTPIAMPVSETMSTLRTMGDASGPKSTEAQVRSDQMKPAVPSPITEIATISPRSNVRSDWSRLRV